MVKDDEPFILSCHEFASFTNSTYLAGAGNVINDYANNKLRIPFLKKLESMEELDETSQLIFTHDKKLNVYKFINSHKKLLHELFKYSILFDKIDKENSEKTQELDKIAKKF